ncbi:putative transporter component [Burkholderiales bacterium JOSHI_001]|nr:putative transporter component [Burkholderiales bacterium JOSHI_001]
MSDNDLLALTRQVLGAAFVLGVLFGAIAQRTHFCTMGALADVVHSGDFTRLRMWALAAAVAMLGFNTLVAWGGVQAANTLYAAPRLMWLSHAVGGLMFGFGMVLASGCGNKTLVRLGGGNLKSLLVLVVMGVSALATLRGITGVARSTLLDPVVVSLPAGQDLPSLLAGASGLGVPLLALGLGAALALALAAWALADASAREADALLGGVGSGLLVVALWWVSSHWGFVAEHPQTLEPAFLATNSRRMESFSFVAPVGYGLDWLMMFSDKNNVVTLGVASTLGVVCGSAVVALATRRFRWEGFGGAADTAQHIVGAVLMGVGGVTALGCTIGQGLSGVSTLSLGSFIAVAAIVAGGLAALHWQVWWLERQA